MSREFDKAVWACYKADGTELEAISSLAEQRTFVQMRGNDHTSDVPDKMNDGEDH